jgi:hypothetical protein
VDNALNRNYNQGAKEMGWANAAAVYEGQAAALGHKPNFIIEKDVERTMRRGRRPIGSYDMKGRGIAFHEACYIGNRWQMPAMQEHGV